MKTTTEKNQQRRRFWRSFFPLFFLLVTICLECFVIGSMLNIIAINRAGSFFAYQMIIPVIGGFSAIVIIVSRKLKPDLYDSYSVTSCATIEQQARQSVELYNYFAEERGEKSRLHLDKTEGETRK